MRLFKNKNSRIILLILFGFLLVIVIKTGCKQSTTQKVAVGKPTVRNITELVEESGKLYPVNEVKVSADAGSLIEAIFVQEGDTVQTGQLIAIVQAEKTSMVNGSRPNNGLQNAMRNGALDPAAIAKALQQTAQPNTPSFRTNTITKNIYAPMNGVVTGMNVKKGERLMGTEIARISSVNEWEVRADIGEVDIVKIKEGNPVKFTIDALGETELAGTVYRISNSNPVSGLGSMPGGLMADITNYKVFIKVNPVSLKGLTDSVSGRQYTLRNGMNANIKIETARKNNVLSVPIKSVTTRFKTEEQKEDPNSGNTKQKPQLVVFVVKNEVAYKKVVTIGIQDMDFIEIISGLEINDQVVTEPFEAIDKILKDAQKVKTVPAKEIFK
jgi:HlyD family secretion protein